MLFRLEDISFLIELIKMIKKLGQNFAKFSCPNLVLDFGSFRCADKCTICPQASLHRDYNSPTAGTKIVFSHIFGSANYQKTNKKLSISINETAAVISRKELLELQQQQRPNADVLALR